MVADTSKANVLGVHIAEVDFSVVGISIRTVSLGKGLRTAELSPVAAVGGVFNGATVEAAIGPQITLAGDILVVVPDPHIGQRVNLVELIPNPLAIDAVGQPHSALTGSRRCASDVVRVQVPDETVLISRVVALKLVIHRGTRGRDVRR